MAHSRFGRSAHGQLLRSAHGQFRQHTEEEELAVDLWWDCSDSLTHSGGFASRLDDKGPNGRDLVEGHPDQQPPVVTVNSISVPSFTRNPTTGDVRELVVSSHSYFGINAITEGEIWIVLRADGGTLFATSRMWFDYTAIGVDWQISFEDVSGATHLGIRANTGANRVRTTDALPSGWFLVRITTNGSEWSVYIDDVETAVGLTVLAGSNNGNWYAPAVNSFRNIQFENPVTGAFEVAEWKSFPQLLTDDQRDAQLASMTSKWAL